MIQPDTTKEMIQELIRLNRIDILQRIKASYLHAQIPRELMHIEDREAVEMIEEDLANEVGVID